MSKKDFKFNITTLILSFTIISMLCSCSTLRDSGVPAPEMGTTETGVATGVALGAGMGALIGSTSGQAGAGMVLGAVAGGTTGAVLGNALETQEKRIDSHDETLGVSTKPTGGASIRSRLWDSADKIEYESNLPSGSKGKAFKYVKSGAESTSNNEEGSKVREEVDPATLPDISSNRQKKSSRLPESKKQVIQLKRNTSISAKNYDNGIKEKKLPVIETSVVKEETPKIELRKPEELSSGLYSDIPVRKPSRNNGNQSRTIKSKKSSSNKSEKLVKKEAKKEPSTAASDSKSSNKVKSSRARIANNSNNNKKSGKVTKISKTDTQDCKNAQEEISRAKDAASDSDKVFYLRRAIRVCPQNSSLRVMLGKVYSRLGLKDDARKEFNTALEFDPANESAQDELSIMMLDSHKSM